MIKTREGYIFVSEVDRENFTVIDGVKYYANFGPIEDAVIPYIGSKLVQSLTEEVIEYFIGISKRRRIYSLSKDFTNGKKIISAMQLLRENPHLSYTLQGMEQLVRETTNNDPLSLKRYFETILANIFVSNSDNNAGCFLFIEEDEKQVLLPIMDLNGCFHNNDLTYVASTLLSGFPYKNDYLKICNDIMNNPSYHACITSELGLTTEKKEHSYEDTLEYLLDLDAQNNDTYFYHLILEYCEKLDPKTTLENAEQTDGIKLPPLLVNLIIFLVETRRDAIYQYVQARTRKSR